MIQFSWLLSGVFPGLHVELNCPPLGPIEPASCLKLVTLFCHCLFPIDPFPLDPQLSEAGAKSSPNLPPAGWNLESVERDGAAQVHVEVTKKGQDPRPG